MGLKEYRLESGLKAYKVAEHLGISRKQLNNIERGLYGIDKLKEEKLSKLYGKDIEEIRCAYQEGRLECQKEKLS